MLRFLAARLAQLLPTFVSATVVTFVLLQLAPGDPIALMSYAPDGVQSNSESIEAWRRLKGLDQGLLVQYARWVWCLVRLDFGHSLIDERPVRLLILECLPNTLLLTGSALVFIYGISVPLGVFGALNRNTLFDRVASATLFVLYSTPAFWMALVLLVFLAGGEFLQLFPIRGLASDPSLSTGWGVRLLDLLWHLALPVLCLTYPHVPRTSYYQRTALLEVMGQDYIRTARAKGLRTAVVVWRHALRNSLLPVVTLISLDLPWLVSGSVIIERIFTIRGMGMLTFEAILRRDYPVIMGVTALVAVVTMVGMLLADLALARLDPRIRLRGGAP